MPTPRKHSLEKRRRGKPAGRAVTSPETLARHQEAADLAVQGLSYVEIAAKMKYGSPSAARYAVKAHFDRGATEAAEHLRPKMVAKAELLWRHAVAVMLEGRAAGDADQFSKGAVAADKALGRLISLHNLTGPAVTVNQVNVGAGATSLDELKLDFMRMLEAGPAVAPVVVEAEVVDTAE